MADPDTMMRGTLGDFFSISREKGSEGLPTLSVTMYDGLVRRDSIDRKTDSELEDGAHLRVRPGDIAYNMMRMWQGASGLATEDGIVSPAYVVVRPKKMIDPLFASYWFKSERMIYLFWAYSYGLTNDRLRLYAKDFTQIPVQLPPLHEQRRIAGLLLDWEQAIEATDVLIAATKQRKRAVMQRIFGDVHNPFAISGTALGRLTTVQYGSAVDASRYEEAGTSWIIGTSGIMGRSATGTHRGPAIIVGRKGTLNKPFYVPDGQLFSAIDTTFIVTAKRNLKAIYHFLTFMDLAKLNAASGVPSLSSEALKEQQVPALSVQASDILDSLDTEIGILLAQSDCLRQQRRGLLQKLLSGDPKDHSQVMEAIAV